MISRFCVKNFPSCESAASLLPPKTRPLPRPIRRLVVVDRPCFVEDRDADHISISSDRCRCWLRTQPTPQRVRRHPSRRPVRLIFKPEVLHRVGLSFPTIWKMMRQGRFPPARIIGGKSAWIESEINDFLAGLPLRRYKSDLSPAAEGDKKAATHVPQSKK